MSANFAPEDFLRSNDIKVRRSNTIFYRELQNCEKSIRKSKNVKKQRGGLALSKVRYLNLKGKDMQKVNFFRYL